MTPRFMASVARMLAPPVLGSDSELLGRYADRGDAQAFAALVERHGAAVRGVCRARLTNAADVDDAVQVVFYVLARDAGRVRDRAAVAGWLVRVAHLTALKVRRHRARHPATALPGELPTPETPDAVVRREQDAIVAEELAALPERLRAVLVLCAVEGQSNTQAATTLGCPRGTVDSRLAAAKSKLRDRLLRRGVGLASVLSIEAGLPRLGAGPPAVLTWSDGSWLAAVHYASGSAPVTSLTLLADGVIPAMTTTTKLAAAALLATALATTAGLGLTQIPGPGPATAPPPPAKPAAAKQPAKPTDPPAKPHATIVTTEEDARSQLDQVVSDFPEQLSFKELCETLYRTYQLPIRLDLAEFNRLKSFIQFGDKGILLGPEYSAEVLALYDAKISLPVTRGMTVGAVLSDAIAQLPVRCSYRLKAGQVLIGPAFRPAAMPNSPANDGDVLIETGYLLEQTLGQSVSVSFDKVPFTTALKELRRLTGANIVLDPGAFADGADTGRSAIGGTFDDVRLYTVLQVLCNQCEVKMVFLDNVYYVTNLQKAEKLQRQANISLYGSRAVPEGYVTDGVNMYPKPAGQPVAK